MNPATHFLGGWLVANVGEFERKDRTLIAVAGVIPDADGIGIVAEVLTRDSAKPLLWWSDYHHIVGHNLTFAVVYSAIVFGFATRRWVVSLLAFVAFHTHILGDLVGARGRGGDQWPSVYLYPFSDAIQLQWSGQWELNAWPNFLITGIFVVATFWLAWKRGYSPVGIFSTRGDEAFVATLRARFPIGSDDSGEE